MNLVKKQASNGKAWYHHQPDNYRPEGAVSYHLSAPHRGARVALLNLLADFAGLADYLACARAPAHLARRCGV